MTLAPGPKRLLYLCHQPEVFRKLQRKYGDVVSFSIRNRRTFLVSRPDLIAQIFRDHDSKFEKAWGPRRGHPVLDGGMLTTEGADHRAQRQFFSKVFSRGAIAAQRPAIAEVIRDWSRRKQPGEAIDVVREMSFIVSDIVARVLFGSRVEPLAAREFGDATLAGFRRVILPIAVRRKYPDATPYADVVVAQIRRNRFREGLLSAVFDMPDCDAHIKTFVIAGQETIRLAMAWSWFLLSAHPEARKRLQAEGRDEGETVFAEAVMRESMRLYPPQWMLGKRALEDYPLGDYLVPASANILISPYVVQRDERWFPDAERFIPERWLGREPSPAAYFPFGGGSRRCIGEAFAMTEGPMILSMLAKDWTFVTNRDDAFDARLTLTPRSMTARLERAG